MLHLSHMRIGYSFDRHYHHYHSFTVKDILDDVAPEPYTLHEFRWYVEFVEQSSENLLFLESYNNLLDDVKSGRVDSGDLAAMSLRVANIAEIFILPGAVLAINIPDSMRQHITSHIDSEARPTLLAPVVNHIANLIQSCTVPEYIRWSRLQSARQCRNYNIVLWSVFLAILTAGVILMMTLPICHRLLRLIFLPFTYWSIGEVVCNAFFSSPTKCFARLARALRQLVSTHNPLRALRSVNLKSPLYSYDGETHELNCLSSPTVVVSTAAYVGNIPKVTTTSSDATIQPLPASVDACTSNLPDGYSEFPEIALQPRPAHSRLTSTAVQSPLAPPPVHREFHTLPPLAINTNHASMSGSSASENMSSSGTISPSNKLDVSELTVIAPWTVQSTTLSPLNTVSCRHTVSSISDSQYSKLPIDTSCDMDARCPNSSGFPTQQSTYNNPCLRNTLDNLQRTAHLLDGINSLSASTSALVRRSVDTRNFVLPLVIWHMCVLTYWLIVMLVPTKRAVC